MKTLLVALTSALIMMLLPATTTSAENAPLKIIMPAGSTGSFNARFQILQPILEKAWGNDVQIVYGKNCILAKSLIDAETGPVITIWQVVLNAIPKCAFPVKDQKVIAIEQNGLRFCTSLASGLDIKDLISGDKPRTVGVSAPYEFFVSYFDDMNKTIGTNLKAVPYKSTGVARRGLLAGDVDFVFISASNSNKLMKSGGKCFYSSLASGEPKWKLPAFASAVDFDRAVLPQAISYPGFNMTEAQLNILRGVFAEVAVGKNESFNKFAGGKDVNLNGTQTHSIKKMKKILLELFDAWKH
jgi:hypothetical protein